MEDETKDVEEEDNTLSCPECGGEVMIVGHCATCLECGFSLCSL